MTRPPLPTGAAERAAIVDAMRKSAVEHIQMAAESAYVADDKAHRKTAEFLRSTAAQIARGEC